MNLFTNLHNPIARHKLYSYIFTHVYISTYNIIYILKAYSFGTKLKYNILGIVL